MNCKNCDNPIIEDAKFCNKCGRPVNTEKSNTISSINIEKINKSFKNTGNSVYAIGWLTIIINVGIYIWNLLDENFAESGLPAVDLSGTFLTVVVAIVFIILGNRIRKLVDKNTKIYLQIIIGLSLLFFVWAVYAGGSVGILFFIVIAYLISSLIKISRAMKNEEFVSTLTSPKYKLNGKGWIIFALGAIILFFVAVGIDLSIPSNSSSSPNINSNLSQENNTYSKADLIIDTVREIKAEMVLPSQLDEVTRLVDISAQPDAIRYHYTLSNVDTSILSNTYLKNFLTPNICGSPDTRSLLVDNEINMEYSYVVDTGEQYFVTFTRSDCF